MWGKKISRENLHNIYYHIGEGLRENLQETIDFPLNMGLSCKFSHKPIH
jgi:hypothetical protein